MHTTDKLSNVPHRTTALWHHARVPAEPLVTPVTVFVYSVPRPDRVLKITMDLTVLRANDYPNDAEEYGLTV